MYIYHLDLKVIEVLVINDIEIGWVPLHDVETLEETDLLVRKVLFGNFIARQRNGEIVAECINKQSSIIGSQLTPLKSN